MLITTWTPTNSKLNMLFDKYKSQLLKNVRIYLDVVNAVGVTGVNAPLDFLYTEKCNPHNDVLMEDAQYSALLVFKGEHTIYVADHVIKNRNKQLKRPPSCPSVSVQAKPGNIVLVKVTRTHWVTSVLDKGVFVAAFIDVEDTDPTSIENIFFDNFERSLNKLYMEN